MYGGVVSLLPPPRPFRSSSSRGLLIVVARLGLVYGSLALLPLVHALTADGAGTNGDELLLAVAVAVADLYLFLRL